MTCPPVIHRPAIRTLRPALALVVVLGIATACTPTSPDAPSTDSTSADASSTGNGSAAGASPSETSSKTSSAAGDSAPEGATPSPAPSTPSDPANASLPEPTTPPAIASPQAAATVVETYFALVDEKKTQDADALWSDAARAAAFRAELAKLGMPRVEVDAPGGVEAAAGSMYVTVPVRFQPTSAPANSRERHGEVTLRRVNDVPGSTEAQRRWHIDHVDVAMTPK